MNFTLGLDRFPPYRLIKEIIGSPLIGRELRVFLRSQKAFAALFFFLIALVIVVSQNWAFFASHWNPGEDIAKGARSLFFALARGHLLFLMLVTPFLMAPLIAEEQEKKTLPLMLSSPVSVTHFILAKGFIPVIYVILLFTAAIPVLALCFLGGGLSANDLLRTYVILLTATLTYGSLGLFCSTLRPRVYEVYLLTVILILLYGFIIPFHGTIWHFLRSMNWEGINVLNHGFHLLSPYYILENEIIVSGGRSSPQNIITFTNPLAFLSSHFPSLIRVGFAQLMHITLSLAMCLLFVVLSVRRIKAVAHGDKVRSDVYNDEEEIEGDEEAYYHDRSYDITFDKTTEEGNPGYVLERRIQWFAKLPVLLRLFYISLIISIIALPLSSFQGSWLFLSIPFMASAFFTLPLAATSISSDRERGTLDILRTSLLSSDQIVKAKFYTSLQYSFLIALALYMPGMLVQIICSWIFQLEVDLAAGVADTLAISWYPIILLCSLVAYTALGLYCSARFQRTNHALIVSGVIIFLTLITPFILPQGSIQVIQDTTHWGLLALSFISPLTAVSVVFPQGTINMPGLLLLVNNMLHGIERLTFTPSQYDPADPLSPQPINFAPYLYAIVQCLICLILAYCLYKKTIDSMENDD